MANEKNEKISNLNEDKESVFKKIISDSLTTNTKLHLVLFDRTFRNGFVKEVSASFFLFEDRVNGVEPIFFSQLKKVEPYLSEKGGENEKVYD